MFELVITIPLSAKNKCKHMGRFVALVSEEDAGLAAMSWQAKISRSGANPIVYAQREERDSRGRRILVKMHRVIWERAYGPIPDGYEVDHKEPGGLDNTRPNLRLATDSQNSANGRRRANNTSGFKGVHYVKRIGRWQALIRVNGKRRHLGYFDTPSEAGAAYDVAAVEAWGEFARLNQAA